MARNYADELGLCIYKALKKEFGEKHLSGNLLNTIEIISTTDGDYVIRIPAQTYNMLLYQEKGVVIHTNHGSYAKKLDKEGSSFMVYPNGQRKGSYRVSPRNHKGFVNKIINEAIQEWLSSNGIEAEVTKNGE